MIKLVSNHTSNRLSNYLLNDIKKANNEIVLCAPFIKIKIIKDLLKCANKNAKITIYTNINSGSFLCGASDVEAIQLLLDKNITIYNFQKLHAKVYICDKSSAIITSSNLTNNALYQNFEYGCRFDDESIVTDILNDFNSEVIKKLFEKYNKNIFETFKNNLIELKKSKAKVIVDEDEDYIISCDNAVLQKVLSKDGWKKEILNIILSFKSEMFYLRDFKKFIPLLQKKYPNNHNIEFKIQQILQQLRDLGLLKFIDRGFYKKLFVVGEK